MGNGFAKLHRSGLKPGTPLYAFHAYLCAEAAYYDHCYAKRIGGRGAGRKVQVDLKPGQLVSEFRQWARMWGVTPKTVRNWTKRLESLGLCRKIKHPNHVVVIEMIERQVPTNLSTESGNVKQVKSNGKREKSPPTPHQKSPPNSHVISRKNGSETKSVENETPHQKSPLESSLRKNISNKNRPADFFYREVRQDELDRIGADLLHPLRIDPIQDASGFIAKVAYLYLVQAMPDISVADLQTICGDARDKRNPFGYIRTCLQNRVPDFDDHFNGAPGCLKLSDQSTGYSDNHRREEMRRQLYEMER